mmetsp:Transcript_21431/g.48533  ORF Transcript_21431/g.48533 Transcript_21431/m.48533 type:complete len:249 (+) Transcript_21431:202-948(+)
MEQEHSERPWLGLDLVNKIDKLLELLQPELASLSLAPHPLHEALDCSRADVSAEAQQPLAELVDVEGPRGVFVQLVEHSLGPRPHLGPRQPGPEEAEDSCASSLPLGEDPDFVQHLLVQDDSPVRRRPILSDSLVPRDLELVYTSDHLELGFKRALVDLLQFLVCPCEVGRDLPPLLDDVGEEVAVSNVVVVVVSQMLEQPLGASHQHSGLDRLEGISVKREDCKVEEGDRVGEELQLIVAQRQMTQV